MDKNTFVRSKISPTSYEKYILNGLNFKFTDIQASLLNAQIKRLNFFLNKRAKIRKLYDKFFYQYKKIVVIQREIKNAKSNNQSYMIVFKKNNLRDQLIKYL